MVIILYHLSIHSHLFRTQGNIFWVLAPKNIFPGFVPEINHRRVSCRGSAATRVEHLVGASSWEMCFGANTWKMFFGATIWKMLSSANTQKMPCRVYAYIKNE